MDRNVKQVLLGWVFVRRGWWMERVNMVHVLYILVGKQNNETGWNNFYIGEKGKRNNDGREEILTKVHYTVSIYGNVTLKPPVQLIYANKNAYREKSSKKELCNDWTVFLVKVIHHVFWAISLIAMMDLWWPIYILIPQLTFWSYMCKMVGLEQESLCGYKWVD
jgi:hypothetical protein